MPRIKHFAYFLFQGFSRRKLDAHYILYEDFTFTKKVNMHKINVAIVVETKEKRITSLCRRKSLQLKQIKHL